MPGTGEWSEQAQVSLQSPLGIPLILSTLFLFFNLLLIYDTGSIGKQMLLKHLKVFLVSFLRTTVNGSRWANPKV